MTTFQILFIFQNICIIIGLIGIFVLLCSMSRAEGKYLIGAEICAEIFALGYEGEMMATTQGEALYASYMQSIGLAYVGVMFAIYIVRMTNIIKVRRRTWMIIIAIETVLAVVALTTKSTGLYYRDMRFVETGLYPHLEFGFSPFLLLNMLLLGGLVIFGLVVTIVAAVKAQRKDLRNKYIGVTVGISIPLLAMGYSLLVNFSDYEPISSFVVLSLGIISIVKSKGRLYDPVEIARGDFFRNSSVAAIVTDANYQFLDCNENAYDFFPELRTIDTDVPVNKWIHLEKFNNDNSLFRLNIRSRYYECRVNDIIDQGRCVGHVLVVADVTYLEEQMIRMEELKKEADSASEAKTVFLANMSHEMRTPLNAIIGLSELSVREDSAEQIKTYVSQIKNSGQVLLDIVSEVLDFSKVESGKLELVPTKYVLSELLNAVINMINVRIGTRNLDFIVNVNPGIPNYLYGDDIRIRQILINFLSNAVKYTSTGHIKFTVDYKKSDSGIVLIVAVEDTGKGIKEEDIDNLFKNFSRVDLNSNRNVQGTGLGLAISARLIELMEGEYDVESTYGKGSCFKCSIPQEIDKDIPIGEGEAEDIYVKKMVPFEIKTYNPVQADSSIEPVKEEKKTKEEAVAQKCEGKKFLVVDDNPINIKVLQALLKLFKIESDSAYSGPEAIEKVMSENYDLIMMDHMMPDMDGIETTQKIREIDRPDISDAVIVACTANAVKGAEELFLNSGFNDYICKPIEMEDLTNLLDRSF